MEGDGRDLEGEADEDEGRADGQQHARSRGGGEDGGEVGRPRRAEDQRDPIDDESRRERAEQEIFNACFLGRHHFAVESGKNVERDGEHFEGKEDDNEVGGLHHEHHANHAEEQQGVVFAALQSHAFDVAKGQRHAEQTADELQGVEEGRETVAHDHAAEGCAGRPAELGEGDAERDGEARGGQRGSDPLLGPGDEQIHQQEHTGPDGKNGQREDGLKI